MNILIVEDEAVAARRLERLTREIFSDKSTDVWCSESLDAARDFIEQHKIDLLLLDLNLNGENGFDLLAGVASYPFQTIVVSASTEHALKAFEFGVIDFVPKPFTLERLRAAFARATKQNLSAEHAARYLSVRNYQTVKLVAVDDIIYFSGAGDYVEINLKNGEKELHSKSLESLEKILPERFMRVHKSCIVDKNEIKRIVVHGGGKYEIELSNLKYVPLSRTKYKEIISNSEALKQF